MSHKHHPFKEYTLDLLKLIGMVIVITIVGLLAAWFILIGRIIIWLDCLVRRDHCAYYKNCNHKPTVKIRIEDLFRNTTGTRKF